jgi:hypothetical protein
MTLLDMCEEAAAISLSTHYNPHWIVLVCKWIAVHVMVALVVLRSKL